MKELNRRSTPVGDSTSMAFKRPSTNSNSSARRSVNPRMTPKNTITVIKAAPKDFPKSQSDESLASSSSGLICEPERPASVSPSESTTTREVSIQTADTKDDDFLEDAIIRHPSASVMDQISEKVHSLKLGDRKHRKWESARQSGYLLDYLKDESLDLDNAEMSPDTKRSSQLAKLQEYSETRAVKPEKLVLTEEEERHMQRIRKNNELRKQRFLNERLMKEKVCVLFFAIILLSNV